MRIKYTYVGLISGIVSGLVGLGGGVIVVPLLVLHLKMLQLKAQGTSLIIVLFSAVAGTIIYSLNSSIDWKAALFLAVGATVSIPFGIHYSHRLPERTLKKCFGGVLILISTVLILKTLLPLNLYHPIAISRFCVLLTIGLATGFLSGLLGVGGGAITVSAMVIFVGMGQQEAQGSALLAMLPAAALGAYKYWKLGNVGAIFIPGILAGIALGTVLGGGMAFLLPGHILRILFTLLLFSIGIQYLRTKVGVQTL
jgi:hypothetical protein